MKTTPGCTLVLPPLTQLNTPYPSISYLARFLREKGVVTTQRDLGIELVLRLFSQTGFTEIFDEMEGMEELPQPGWRALAMRRQHVGVIDAVVAFLQGRDRTLAPRILGTPILPRGPRLDAADLDGFGPLGVEDAARHLATLYLSDLADLVTACIDPGFGLARYHHHLAVGARSFDPLAERLGKTTLVDRHLDTLADTLIGDVVAISVPFPGNLYGALRIGRRVRARGGYVVLGGGYVNTELRDTDEPRLWEYLDALCLDDGEGPLLAILEERGGGVDRRFRTRKRDGWCPGSDLDTPTTHAAWYGDLDLSLYLQLVDGPNPAHRLWSDGRWNKVTLAHGCYWKQCSFCDINLDYISRYVPAQTVALVDTMIDVSHETGGRGFHLVDEAAPPRGMRDLALELLTRQEKLTWWGNIRFEKAFTPDLARLCAAAGLVAVTGGLEVASDRLLERMQKGVTIEQVVTAARAFRDAGVLVHAYLMYGFPTQTDQESVDAMEVVRQMFASGVLDSAFWHRFVLTRHSGIFPEAAKFGVGVDNARGFANNDLPHTDPTGGDHDRFDEVLPRALAAWMRGRELDRAVHTWGDDFPLTTEAPDRVRRAMSGALPPLSGRLVWLGGDVLQEDNALVLHHADGVEEIRGEPATLDWLGELLTAVTPGREFVTWESLGKVPALSWGVVRRAGLVGV